MDSEEKAFCIDIPVLVKSRIEDGKRLVEVEASNEVADLEGDVILQKALLDSADAFLRRGHIDIDHLSEIGHRLIPPLKDPASYIIGRPTQVKDMGGGRTAVVSEIFRAKDGVSRPEINRFDAFWESLQGASPTPWRASIFGYPLQGEVEDCSRAVCPAGASRWLVKGIDWRSLAFTRTPVNDAITGFAQITTAKSWMAKAFAKNGASLPADIRMAETMGDSFTREVTPTSNNNMSQSLPVLAESQPTASGSPCAGMTREALWGRYQLHIKRGCPLCKGGVNVATLRNHFLACDGMPFNHADILALALMHLIRRERGRA